MSMCEGYTIEPAPLAIEHAARVYKTFTLEDFLSANLPPRKTILAPWLPAKGLAMVYGPRGIGKTLFVLSVAHAIATGGSFLRWQSERSRKVIIIDGEMPAELLQERLRIIAAASTSGLPNKDYLRLLAMDMQDTGRNLNLATEQSQNELEPELGDAEVVVVDNLSTLAGYGRENESESWDPIQYWALNQRRAGRTVVFVHHAGKAGGQRGTSKKEDALDTVIALQRPADFRPEDGARFNIAFEKSRGFFGNSARPFEAALGAEGWSARDVVDRDVEKVVALAAQGMSERKIAATIGISKSQVNRLKVSKRERSTPEVPISK